MLKFRILGSKSPLKRGAVPFHLTEEISTSKSLKKAIHLWSLAGTGFTNTCARTHDISTFARDGNARSSQAPKTRAFTSQEINIFRTHVSILYWIHTRTRTHTHERPRACACVLVYMCVGVRIFSFHWSLFRRETIIRSLLLSEVGYGVLFRNTLGNREKDENMFSFINFPNYNTFRLYV